MTLALPTHRRTGTAAGLTTAAAMLGLSLLATPATAATPASDAAAREAWRAALAHATLPASGCFKANYPEAVWTRVACVRAPQTPYIPRHATSLGVVGNTVGDGADYAAVVTHLITSGVGSFPSITGLTSESDGSSNTYSLQLNSNFFTTTVCNGATNPSSCLGWQQFVYSTSSRAAFMQYWLINYGSRCPSGGWMAYSGDCYRNSAAVTVPKQTLANLAKLTVTGTAAASGTDKMVLTTPASAYTTTGNDSVVKLAAGWKESEYNVVGDGGGSEAVFNKGTSINVKIALQDGATTAPTCESNDGTTGETNNLTLGACTTASGSSPSISFTESR